MSNLYLNVADKKCSSDTPLIDLRTHIFKSFYREGVLPLLVFIGLFFIIVICEFSTGFVILNFQLMVDSLHNLLNVLALGFSLFSVIVARLPKDERFTYGYSRLEIIAAFANCCFLLFLCIFNLFHSIHEFIEAFSDEEEHDHSTSPHPFNPIVAFNTLRLVIYMIGALVFRKFATLYPKQKSDSTLRSIFQWLIPQKDLQYKKNDNDSTSLINPKIAHSSIIGPNRVIFHSLYLYFVIETLISLTFVSFHVVECLHKTNSEALFAIVLLVYTLKRAGPVFFLTTDVLLQALPASHENEIKGLLKRVCEVPGIVKIDRSQYWALSPNYLVICVSLKVSDEAVMTEAVSEAKSILQGYFTEVLVQARFERVAN